MRQPGLLRAALCAALWVLAACEDSPPTLLSPPVGLCFSEVKTIQLAGEFSNWDLAQSTAMRQREDDCLWRAVVRIDAPGEYLFKFVTDGSFDNPEDFVGNDETQVLGAGEEHPVERGGGTGTALRILVGVEGCYEFLLDEDRLRFWFEETSCATGAIRGTLEFEGVSQPPLPKARVRVLFNDLVVASDSSLDDGSFEVGGLEAGVYTVVVSASGYLDARREGIAVGLDATNVGTIALQIGCASDFNLIQIVGDFTDPEWEISVSPVMSYGSNCAWRAVVRFTTPGEHIFKFVTGGAFDSPPDFGGDESVVLSSGMEHDVLRGVTGPGTALKIDVPQAGCYEFLLHDGRSIFLFREVACSGGGIRGRLEFDNVATPPLPRARVQALQGGIVVASDSSSIDGSFEILGLDPGRYDLNVRTFGYLDSTLSGIDVGETPVDVGAIQLTAGCFSAFTSIRVVGEITTPPWQIDIAPQLTQVSGCIWEAEIDVSQGQRLFKLVTDDTFDSPPDYGSDEQLVEFDETNTANVSLSPASGQGTAILVLFPFSGSYHFFFDEEARLLRIQPADVPGNLAGVVVFEGIAGTALPVAHVRVLDGDTELAVTTTSPLDGSFRIEGIDQGVFTVRVEPPAAAPSFDDVVLQDVGIGGGRTTNVGQVLVRGASGGLRGSLSFPGVSAAPYPVARVNVWLGTDLAATRSTTTTSTNFEITGLKAADYEVRISANNYFERRVTVSVSSGVSDLGSVILERIICDAYPDITILQLGGDRVPRVPGDNTFSWNLAGMPVMRRLDRCTWDVDVTCEFQADYKIKFISNRDFRGSLSVNFGGDDVTVTPADSLGSMSEDRSDGIANTLRIQIADPGIYRFSVDLQALTFRYTRIADLPDDNPPLEAKLETWMDE